MRAIRFDIIGGVSGDMTLAALIDLGVPRDRIVAALRSLPVDELDIAVTKTNRKGLAGTQVHVHVGETNNSHHAGPSENGKHAHHTHRHLADIRKMLEHSSLPARVISNALNIFTRLAEAEASVHGTTVEAIHFHEVGAMDSIVDIVGSCIALDLLNVDMAIVSAFPLGTGTVQCAHGTMPLPVPATLELLKGFATIQTDEPFELVTPTGAALMTTLCSRAAIPAGATVNAIGYGIGHRVLNNRTNALRAALLDEPAEAQGGKAPCDCLLLECNIDDSTPEHIGYASEKLLNAGALDVYSTSVFMKKQRPGILLSVLCRHEQREAMLTILFRETSTFGVREQSVARTCLDRETRNVSTVYGDIAVKYGFHNGEQTSSSPEFESCRQAAARFNVPLKAVYEAAKRSSPAIQVSDA